MADRLMRYRKYRVLPGRLFRLSMGRRAGRRDRFEDGERFTDIGMNGDRVDRRLHAVVARRK